MNILFLNAYFEPETIAFTHLENDIVNNLVKESNEIFVLTPIPTRCVSEKNKKKYSKSAKEELYEGHVHVFRFWAPQEGRNPFIRAFRYFWCNIREYQLASNFDNIDVIFSNSTPPTQGYLACKVKSRLSKKYRRNVPFVFNMQDIFPDSLVSSGLTKKGSILWRIGKKIEIATYRGADQIIAISDGFKSNLIHKAVPEKKIQVISNWINTGDVYPVAKTDNHLFDEYNINRNKFIILYAGNLGEAQDTEVILDAAEILKDNTDIQFVVFGGGSGYEAFKQQIITQKLNNVFIHKLLEQNRISEVYSLGDIDLITCKAGTGESGLPSKLWSIMACNRFIIAAFDKNSDLESVLMNSKAGICIKPGDANELANSIIKYKYKSNDILCVSGRSYVQTYASSARNPQKYCEIIKNVVT